jgi:hypothetical protein
VLQTAAVAILAIHLAWIIWVIFGSIWTKGRPFLTCFHIASIVWGILVEISPWPCPLTLAEQFFEFKVGIEPYHGSFLLHYLDAVVYPNISASILVTIGIIVCVLNLAIYAHRLWRLNLSKAHHNVIS